MRFLADENIATSVVSALRQAEHDVFDVKEAGWHGKPDQVLAKQAAKQRRIILTHDKDFLAQTQAPVILLRFYNQWPVQAVKHLLAFLNSAQSAKLTLGVRVILQEDRVEIHQP